MAKERTGIEGKWSVLADEREELREKVKGLEAENQELKTWKEAFDKTEFATVLQQRDEARTEIEALKAVNAKELLALSEEELDAMQMAWSSYTIITNVWGLKTRKEPLEDAIGVFAAYVQQHLLSRLDPETWGNWWKQ